MWNFQRKVQKLRNPTDRYKCISNTLALYGSQACHPQCQSVLIFPLDQAIHSLIRCKILENVPQGGGFSTEKSEITLSNGQMHVHKQRTCIVWATSTPLMVSKRAHLSVRSSNWLTCPLRNFGTCEFSTEKSEITPPNGQIQVCKQCACIAWTTSTLSTMSKCGDLSVGSSNILTCPLLAMVPVSYSYS